MDTRRLTTIHDMSRLFDIRDVLHLNARKKVIVCPLPQHPHHHRTPSFSIFTTPAGKQRWKCFGSCGLEGDVVDLVGFLDVPGYNPRSRDDVKRALALLTGGTPINPPAQVTTKKPQIPNGLWKRYIPAGDDVVQYAAKRFLTSETLERFHIGQLETFSTRWATIPTLHGEQLRGIKLRNLNSVEKKDRYRSVEGSIDGLFNYNEVNGTTQPVAILKGEFATMTLSQFGILSCNPTGGEGSYYNHEEFLRPLAFSRRRIVIGDNDTRPDIRAKMQAAAAQRKEIFKAAGLYFPPDPFVGIDDWIIAQPEVAVPTIKSWMDL